MDNRSDELCCLHTRSHTQRQKVDTRVYSRVLRRSLCARICLKVRSKYFYTLQVFFFLFFCPYNNNNSFFLGDKRPYLSLPRPGVSVTPFILINVSMIQTFVILWLIPLSFSPQKHLANMKTAKAVKLDAEVAHTPPNPRAFSTIHHVSSCTVFWQQYIHL